MIVLNKLLMFVMTFVFLCDVSHGKNMLKEQRFDALLSARCDIKCWNHEQGKKECIRKCIERLPKPGRCAVPSERTPFEAICINACSRDSDCLGLTKCCRHECGATCHEPRNLLNMQGLPAIPDNVNVAEGNRGKNVKISWTTSDINKSSLVFYVLEERHHIGKYFSQSRLGQWTVRKRVQKSSTVIKDMVKPGRWYQFRVAAVNINGTRGYSSPSSAFQLLRGPKPPRLPQNLSVDALSYYNGSLSTTLHWRAPNTSDLPIQKYKVFWSHRIQGIDQDLNSVMVHHQTVGKHQTKIELKDLIPNSLYFLQVQAVVQYGGRRLKSDKAATFLNTTNFPNESTTFYEGNGLRRRELESRIEGLHIQKMKWMKDQLVAYIAWKSVPAETNYPIRYNVQWWTGHCKGSEGNQYKIRTHTSATTDATKFKLHNLFFDCKYLLRVNKIIDGQNYPIASEINFKSPTCEQVRIRFKLKNENIKCD